ncbi:MAG TPA: cupin domain-containing protein [Pirellulales bacterium]|nr:cupin domain-containing protein [Pirellulales bacterium]
MGDVYRFLATGKETSGRYATFEAIVPPGGGPPPHTHSREDESFYILEGEMTFYVEGERIVAKPGTFASMPVGVKHCFKNESHERARMIISVAPAGLEEMFLAAGSPIDPGAVPGPPSPDDIARLLELAPRYGVTIELPAGH